MKSIQMLSSNVKIFTFYVFSFNTSTWGFFYNFSFLPSIFSRNTGYGIGAIQDTLFANRFFFTFFCRYFYFIFFALRSTYQSISFSARYTKFLIGFTFSLYGCAKKREKNKRNLNLCSFLMGAHLTREREEKKRKILKRTATTRIMNNEQRK